MKSSPLALAALGALGILAGWAGCSLKPELGVGVKVKLAPRQPSEPETAVSRELAPSRPTATTIITMPASSSGMDCFAVNVSGPGIVSEYSSSSADPVPWDCLGFGVVSTMVSASRAITEGIELKIPSGQARAFQVLGIVTGSGSSACDGQSLPQLLSSGRPAVYELGRSVATSLFRDGAEVTVNDAFTPGTEEMVSACLDTAPKLTALYTGKATSTGFFTDSLGTSLPPVGLSSPFTSPISNGSFFGTLPVAVTPGGISYARADFVLDATSAKLGQFQRLQVTIDALGGQVPEVGGICQTPTTGNFTGGGYTVRAWIGGASPHWSNQDGTTLSPLSTLSFFYLDENSDVAPEKLPYSEGGGSYIHLSLRSNTSGNLGSTCSALYVKQLILQLSRAQ
jgi:hypothetical protein